MKDCEEVLMNIGGTQSDIGDEMLDEIDAFNNVIGKVGKLESYWRKVSHRIVHVMVVHEDRLFLVRRAMGVRYLPGFYCSSAGGHVQAGEDVEHAALRELDEEIGLAGPVRHLAGFFFEHEFRIHIDLFIRTFDATNDRIHLNPAEVMNGQFYSLAEIEALDHGMFHPQLAPCLKILQHGMCHAFSNLDKFDKFSLT